MSTQAQAQVPVNQVMDKGLKKNAIGFVSNIVIGVASTAPAYSIAATLGFIIADPGITTHAPAVMLAAFIPALLVSVAYRYLNKADPDAGTSFAWGTRAFGPTVGWMNGWAIFLADLLVMASLGLIAAVYTYQLFGWTYGETHKWVELLGCVAWILLMTWVCHRGIELSARIQQILLSFEVVMLVIFSVVALVDVYSGTAGAGAMHPQLSWFNPFDVSFHDLLVAMLLGVFLYWGWDSGVSVNEESEDSAEGPGRAAVISTLLLVLIYLLVTASATAFHGFGFFIGESEGAETHREDILHALGQGVLGSVGVKFLIVAVLTSAAASTQTTILPTARTTLSMAHWGAIPRIFAKVHPRYLTPTASTWGFGLVSIIVAVPLILISSEVLELAVVALGIPVCFYYGMTGFASVMYYRKELTTSARHFFLVGLVPLLGGLGFFAIGGYAIYYYGKAENAEGKEYLGLTLPIWLGVVGLLIGLVIAFFLRFRYREFFSRKLETATPGVLDAPVEHAPMHLMGSEHVTTAEHPFRPEADAPVDDDAREDDAPGSD